MKPIFLIGATMLAAGTAFGFAVMVDQQALPQNSAKVDRGLAVERIHGSARKKDSAQNPRPALTPESDKARVSASGPADSQVPSLSAQSNTVLEPSELPAPTASEQVAALDYDPLSTQPMLYLLAPGGQDISANGPGATPAIENPDPLAVERFERLPFIGVYR